MAEKKPTPKEIKEQIVQPPEPAPTSVSPPMFVKVEKYRDVIKNIQQLRSYVVGLRDALDAIAEIEKELKTGMDIAHKALDSLNMIISSLDTKLLRVQGVETGAPTVVEPPREIEGYIKGVYEQIEKLKSELKAIS